MKVNLYEFLDMIGNIEVEISERLDNGKERPLCIGYPDEIKEHLELSFSTCRYQVFFISQIKKGEILELVVVDED